MTQGLSTLRQGSELGTICLEQPSLSENFVRADTLMVQINFIIRTHHIPHLLDGYRKVSH